MEMLSKRDFPEALNGHFKPALTHCRCPKCKSQNLTLTESIEAETTFEVREGRLNRQAGIHNFGNFIGSLRGSCTACGHKWRIRKATQIIDVTTELNAETLKPLD